MARVRTGAVLLAGCALAAALQGCVGPSAFPSFDVTSGPEDVLPLELSAVLDEEGETREVTVRFVAEYEGHDLYLIRYSGLSPCLGIANGGNSVISCGGADGRLTVEASTIGTFELAPAPIGELDGWAVLSENVRVKN